MNLLAVVGLCLTVWLNFSADAGMICYPEHVQTKFCNADFVIRAKITSAVQIEVPDLPTPPRNRGNGSGHNKDNNTKKPFKELIPIRGKFSRPEPRRFARSLGLATAGIGYGMVRKHPQYLDIKIKRILKGAGRVNKTIGTSMSDTRYYGRVYVMDPMIGMKLKSNKVYLLAGKIVQNRMYISACSWYDEWERIGLDQLRGLKKGYVVGCHAQCRVQMCFYYGCENSKYGRRRVDVCMWRPDEWSAQHGTKNDCKVKHSACRKIEGRCQWKHSPGYLKCKKNKEKQLP